MRGRGEKGRKQNNVIWWGQMGQVTDGEVRFLQDKKTWWMADRLGAFRGAEGGGCG